MVTHKQHQAIDNKRAFKRIQQRDSEELENIKQLLQENRR